MAAIFLAVFFLALVIYEFDRATPIAYLLLQIGLIVPLIIAAAVLAGQ